MVIVTLHGVNQVRKRLADGSRRIYFYHRATGIRLPDDPASLAFQKRLAELNEQGLREPSKAKPGSIDALIAHYKSSREYRSLGERTQKGYARQMDVIALNWGCNMVRDIDREAVINLRDAYQDTPRTANYIVSVLRLLLTFAIDRPKVYGLAHNPAARPKQFKTGEGHQPWEEYQLEQFCRTWAPDTPERIAFELLLNTGQRGGDVIAMSRAHYVRGSIAVTQEKTKARVWIPASERLQAVLDPWLASHGQMTLLVGRNGQPMKVNHFRHAMRAAYDKAGLGSETTTHGLRYTAATMLHELGCDWETIASITGHETAEMVRKYTAKKRRASVAITKLDEARRSDS